MRTLTLIILLLSSAVLLAQQTAETKIVPAQLKPGSNGTILATVGTVADWVDPNTFLNFDDGDWTVSGGNVYRAGGNVGLGIADPTDQLHINNGAITFTGDLAFIPNKMRIYRSATNGLAFVGAGGTVNDMFFGSAAGAAIVVNPKATNDVVIGGNGNVTIGSNTAPSTDALNLFGALWLRENTGFVAGEPRIYRQSSGGLTITGWGGAAVSSMTFGSASGGLLLRNPVANNDLLFGNVSQSSNYNFLGTGLTTFSTKVRLSDVPSGTPTGIVGYEADGDLVDYPLASLNDGDGIYSGSGTVPTGTVITSPQTSGFSTGYFQFGVNASGPLNDSDNFPLFGFGYKNSDTDYGTIGFTFEGSYQLPQLRSNDGIVSARGFNFSDGTLEAGFANTGSTMKYTYTPISGNVEAYTFPREKPATGQGGSWVFNEAGDFAGFGEDIVYKVVRTTDLTRSGSGGSNDDQLVISNIAAGLYAIDANIEYTTSVNTRETYWKFFCTNEIATGSGYRREGSRIKKGIEDDNFDSSDNTTAARIIDILDGKVRFSSSGVFRFNWGGGNATGSTTVKAHSYIILRRIAD